MSDKKEEGLKGLEEAKDRDEEETRAAIHITSKPLDEIVKKYKDMS